MRSARAGVLAGLILLFAGGTEAPGQDRPAAPSQPVGRPLTLPDVLQHAVRHSPSLATARIDVTVAEARVLEASGIEDWVVGLSGSVVRTKNRPAPGVTFQTTEDTTWTGQASLSKLFFTGGRLSVFPDVRRVDSTLLVRGLGENASTEILTSLTARLDQPLLRGAGETVTRAQQTRARLARDGALLQRESVARTEVRELVASYWEVALAATDLEIRRSSVDLARERRRLTEASVKGGATAPTELNAVDQVLAQREEEVAVAELAVVERSLELRQRAGMEIGASEVLVAATSVLEVEPRPFDLAQVVGGAIEASPEIALLRTRDEGAKLEVAVTENGLLPRLDLAVFGGPLGRANKLTTALERTTDLEDYHVGAELSGDYALGNNSAEGASRRARAERELVMVDMADLQRQIAASAVRAVALANSAEKRMALSRTAIELSEKNIKAEIGRFELGKSTNFDVLLRQDELKQARLRHARAVADYLRARAFIGALTGQILPEYGIKID